MGKYHIKFKCRCVNDINVFINEVANGNRIGNADTVHANASSDDRSGGLK